MSPALPSLARSASFVAAGFLWHRFGASSCGSRTRLAFKRVRRGAG
jgi:hypothetical protein